MSDESRLSQIEKLLETSAKMIVRHDKMVERHDQEIADIREQTARNADHLAQLSDMFIESIKVIKEMQNQVRGIQTENQRLMKHLFGDE